MKFIILILAVEISCQQLNSTLRSTEYGVHFAYVAEPVTFTCMTAGSNSIAWSSDEYIGADRLEFASVEPDGTTRSAPDSGANAQLVSSSRVNGIVILITQLQLTVSSVYRIASITCHNVGNDTITTTSFSLAGNTSVECDKQAACSGERVSCTCTIAHLNTLAWSSNQLIGPDDARLEFRWSQPLLTRQNVSNSSTFAVLTDRSNVNGVVLLKSEINFVVTTSGDIVLQCSNVDRQNPYSVIIPLSTGSCAEIPTANSAPSTTDNSSTTAITIGTIGTDDGIIIGMSVVLAVLGSITGVLIFAVTVLAHYLKRKGQQVKGLERINMEMGQQVKGLERERDFREKFSKREQQTQPNADVKDMLEGFLEELRNSRYAE